MILYPQPTRVSLIAAVAQDNAIGRNNQLLWKLSNDMKFFKNTTWALPVIMGRNTFESMGKPLQGRTNIVLTRSKEFQHEGVLVASSLNDALALAAQLRTREVLIIGGAAVYEAALPLASTIYLTRVMAFFPDADAHFPGVNWQQWHLASESRFEPDSKNEFAHHIQQWERKYGIAT